MSPLQIIGGILMIITSIVIIIVVMMQEGGKGGMNAISGGGGAESYLGKNKGRTLDVMLSRVTKIAAAIFFVVTIAVNVIAVFVK